MFNKKGLYKGYSSFEYERTKTFSINDIELVKMDLLNHIHTVKGSRVMMPNFGTQIPLLVFEQLDEITLDILRNELTEVFNYDPRVEIVNLQIQPIYDEGRVYVLAELLYIELNQIDKMELNIEFAV